MKTGILQILNVGDGDAKLSFNSDDPAEVKRAKRIVEDMLKRGYSLLVQVGDKNGEPLYQRAHGFDPETCEYIIASTDNEVIDIGTTTKTVKTKKKRSTKRIPAKSTNTVAVARTAGG